MSGSGAVAILGLGASGSAAARLALDKGVDVYVSDTRSDAATATRADELRTHGAVVEIGTHDMERIAAAATVVASPGIPPDAPVLRVLRERGIRWISEPEFAFRFLQAPLIAVTGTNGKTTTASILAHLMTSAGIDVGLGGNVGAGLGPAASELARQAPPPEWLVLEVSSFQLADIETFRPDIGVFTNLAPDHLDRYPDVATYYADKARLFETADQRSVWVLNADDPEVLRLAGDTPGRRYHFTLRSELPVSEGTSLEGGGFIRDETLTLEMAGRAEPLVEWSEIPLLGMHNRANALAAALAARLAGAGSSGIAAGLRTVRPLPHRLEPVAEGGGILWLDDSKATNVAAAVSAVRSLEGRTLVVLLGGKDKGEDFSPLGRVLAGRVRRVLVYGAAAGRILEALGPDLPVERGPEAFDGVVRRAAEVARPGDVVLLAPACSSFDMFADYEDRGRQFARLARAVTGEAA